MKNEIIKINKTGKQKKNRKVEVDVKVPTKLEREIKTLNKQETMVGLNNRKTKPSYDRMHSFTYDPSSNSLRVKGTSLLEVISVGGMSGPTAAAYMWRRLFLHPSLLFSRKLNHFGKLYSKYKFKEFSLEFVGNQAATQSGMLHFAYSKDFSIAQPLPGVSTLAWLSEMDGYDAVKVFDSKRLKKCSMKGDLNSYYMDRSETDPTTVYQNSVWVGITSDVPYTNAPMIGELFCHYDIEFSTIDVPPTNFEASNLYTAGGGAFINNTMRWQTSSTDQIAFWSVRQGIYYGTLSAMGWSGFLSTTAAAMNFYGSSFILSVQAVVTSGFTGVYTAIEFELYESLAALLDNNGIEVPTGSADNLYFNGVCLLSTDAPIIETSNPIQTDGPVGISVGPGVLSGLPDVVPSLDFHKGRIHLGAGTPQHLRK